jgi:hypothetical protein
VVKTANKEAWQRLSSLVLETSTSISVWYVNVKELSFDRDEK